MATRKRKALTKSHREKIRAGLKRYHAAVRAKARAKAAKAKARRARAKAEARKRKPVKRKPAKRPVKRKPVKRKVSKATRAKISASLKATYKRKRAEKAKIERAKKATGAKISASLKAHYKRKRAEKAEIERAKAKAEKELIATPETESDKVTQQMLALFHMLARKFPRDETYPDYAIALDKAVDVWLTFFTRNRKRIDRWVQDIGEAFANLVLTAKGNIKSIYKPWWISVNASFDFREQSKAMQRRLTDKPYPLEGGKVPTFVYYQHMRQQALNFILGRKTIRDFMDAGFSAPSEIHIKLFWHPKGEPP